MTVAQQILTQPLQLPANERAKLAHELIVSLEIEPADEGYDAAWEQELSKRIKSLDDGTAELLDWRESHAEIRRELREKRA